MNNYSIIVLGVSGSGKTVFLASLFKTFSTSGKFGFFLEAENSDKRKSLNKIYERLITGESWPPGTRNTGQWTFNCCVKNSELSDVQACTLTYVDYAGGLITDSSTEAGDYSTLESSIKNADAVLALIDGQKLLSLMQDKDSDEFILKDLPNIMQLVDRCSRNTPVHFIISKWDLLENSYSLAEVRNCLLNTVTEFNNVVGNRKKAGCPVRLIPISSVGKGFAILKPNGQMEKTPGKIPVPLNLEVPLAFALTDKQHNQIDDPKPSSNSQPKAFKRNIIIYIFLGLGFLLIVLQQWGFLIAVAVVFLIWMFVKKKQNTTKKDASTASSQESVSNINAFDQVLNRCKSIQQEFLAKFPDSNL
jgi:hypothetical protein